MKRREPAPPTLDGAATEAVARAAVREWSCARERIGRPVPGPLPVPELLDHDDRPSGPDVLTVWEMVDYNPEAVVAAIRRAYDDDDRAEVLERAIAERLAAHP